MFVQVSVFNHMHMVKGTYVRGTSACYFNCFVQFKGWIDARRRCSVLYIHWRITFFKHVQYRIMNVHKKNLDRLKILCSTLWYRVAKIFLVLSGGFSCVCLPGHWSCTPLIIGWVSLSDPCSGKWGGVMRMRESSSLNWFELKLEYQAGASFS